MNSITDPRRYDPEKGVFLGVDGGGTKTAFALLETATAGSSPPPWRPAATTSDRASTWSRTCCAPARAPCARAAKAAVPPDRRHPRVLRPPRLRRGQQRHRDAQRDPRPCPGTPALRLRQRHGRGLGRLPGGRRRRQRHRGHRLHDLRRARRPLAACGRLGRAVRRRGVRLLDRRPRPERPSPRCPTDGSPPARCTPGWPPTCSSPPTWTSSTWS